jgi:DNA-binding response OmpR family regulator
MAAKILTVDDEPSITKLVSATLMARGYEVITASSGPEALAAAATQKPALIILDIMMPGMDGKEVHRRLAADPATAKIPILFLSAVGDFEGQLHEIEAGGFVDFITKPFAPADLGERVMAILDPKQREQYERERQQRENKLRRIVGIMHRDRDA